MKKITLFFIAFVLLGSCGTQKLPVRLELSSVNGSSVNGMQFTDDNISIDWWYINKARINFKLKNNSTKNIKLIWDNAAYVDGNGKVERVMHAGVKYADRNESQASSVIPSEAFLEDAIIPVGTIGYTQYTGWYEGTLFGFSNNQKMAKIQKENTFGKTVKVVLPIEIDEVVVEYVFTFTINDPKT